MKNSIKKIIEDSFDKNLRKNKESKASYTSNLLDKKFSDYIWNVMYIYLGDNNSYSFSGNGTNYFCIFKNYGIIIYALKEKNEEIERLEEDIKSISNEKSELKDKLNDSEIKIKNYEFIINEHKLKSEKFNIEKESLQKNLIEKEKEIIDLQNEKVELECEIFNLKDKIKEKKGKSTANKTFYTREQMLALNFESTDSKLRYAIPCLKKDLFVDVEKKLYDKFPQYKEKNYNFLCQGKTILRFKTVEENQLVSGIPIIIPII